MSRPSVRHPRKNVHFTYGPAFVKALEEVRSSLDISSLIEACRRSINVLSLLKDEKYHDGQWFFSRADGMEAPFQDPPLDLAGDVNGHIQLPEAFLQKANALAKSLGMKRAAALRLAVWRHAQLRREIGLGAVLCCRMPDGTVKAFTFSAY